MSFLHLRQKADLRCKYSIPFSPLRERLLRFSHSFSWPGALLD